MSQNKASEPGELLNAGLRRPTTFGKGTFTLQVMSRSCQGRSEHQEMLQPCS